MTVISQMIFSNAFQILNIKYCILIQISLKFVPKDPIYDKSALVQGMAWCRTDNKPLPEPMLTQFTDATIVGDEVNYLHCVSIDLR